MRIGPGIFNWVVLLALTTAGCASKAREVSGDELLTNMKMDPLDCIVYRGSDSTYSYFDRVHFKTKTSLKVRREEVELPADAKVGKIPVGMKVRAATTQVSG